MVVSLGCEGRGEGDDVQPLQWLGQARVLIWVQARSFRVFATGERGMGGWEIDQNCGFSRDEIRGSQIDGCS